MISTAMIVIKMNNNPIDMILKCLPKKNNVWQYGKLYAEKKKWVFRKRTSPIRGIGILVHRLTLLVPIHRSTFAWHLMRD